MTLPGARHCTQPLETLLLLLCETLATSIWYGCTSTLCIALGQLMLQGVVRAKRRSSPHVPLLAVQARSSRKTFDLSSRPTRSLSSRYVISSQPAGLKMDSNRS